MASIPDPQVFRLGKLIAYVRKLGSSDLYEVRLVGLGKFFETFIPADNEESAAYEVIQELVFAATHPKKFFIRRKFAAEQYASESPHRVEKMIEHANDAISYAQKMKRYLINAINMLNETYQQEGENQ